LHNKAFKISVVIPTYNRAKELVLAVKSASAQTFPVHEILVCDDGSSDNSKQLVMELNDPKVKWIDCGKNGGPAIPRNIGIKQSTGNWIALLDSDDEWLPSKIEKQIEAVERLAVMAVCTNASRMRAGEDKGPYLDYSKEIIGLTDLFHQNSIICSSVMVSKLLLSSTSLFPEDKHLIAFEDFSLWLRLSTKSNFAYVREPLVKYFDNVETSIRSGFQMDSWDVYGIVIPDFKNWVKQHKINLSAFQKQELKALTKRIKNKGIPTAWDEFKRKTKAKLKLKK
jgi:glycosyltransferase involved in cell wall biosynthesis